MEGPLRPYSEHIPKFLLDSYGKWVNHRVLEPGVIEHTSYDGKKVYTIRAASTPNGRYSTITFRALANIARKFCGGYMRFTQAVSPEFITDRAENVRFIKEELGKLGFPVGGWGNHLWNITSCAGYFHCALAATDAPSIAQAIGNNFAEYFNEKELPAKLTISVSGCPSSCGGGFLTDISIEGIHTEVPVVTADASACDPQGTAFVCPVGAIQIQSSGKGGFNLQIRKNLCIGCGLCVGACPGIIFETPEKTDGHAIIVGGRASAGSTGTMLGSVVVPFIPNDPPHYSTTISAVKRIIETWITDAMKGERIIDWINRIGWEKFFQKTGLPFHHQNISYLDMRGLMMLREGGGR